MFRWLSLLLPAVIPSWRFFQTIEPSPRIEYRVSGGDWQIANPVPERVRTGQMLARLFWNPTRNDALFMTSCAERIIDTDRAHAKAEILQRLQADLRLPDVSRLEFRLITIRRVRDSLESRIVFTSTPGPR